MDEPLRVALVPDRLFFGGVCRVVRDLWLALPKSDVKSVALLDESEADDSDVASSWFSTKLGEVTQACLKSIEGRRKAGLVRKSLLETKCDVTNLHFNVIEGASLAVVLGAAMARRPIAITFHHLDEIVKPTLKRRLAIWLILALARVVIVTTPLMVDRVRSYHKKVRVEVVPLGVFPTEHTYDSLELRRQYGIPEKAFVIGHLSRMIAGKGLPRVVAAVKELLAKDADLWVVSCGADDQDRESLEQLLKSELPNNSTMLGFLEDQHEALSCCDVLVVPSGWEGFGLVYVEAAMHGMPRIGTDKGGVPYVIDDGIDGFLIPEGDIESLSDKIDLLYTDRNFMKQMGQAAKTRALSDFTAEKMAAGYAAIFKGIA